MVIMDNEWNLKEEIPTTRFWLMTKLRLGWDKKWDVYINGLRERLIEMMTVPGISGIDAGKAKNDMANHIIEKLENSAWRTMPSEFLKQLGIPRVLRH